jgi:FHA domain
MTATDLKSYRPGSWFGVFGAHATVLLPPSEKARVAALWELVDGGADFDEVLDALISSGLRDLPGFVLVNDVDGTTKVVLRGPARCDFTTVDGESIELDGTAASTWVERTLTGVQSMRVSLEEPDEHDDSHESDESDDGGGFTITAGLVRVGRVDKPPYVAERVGSYVDKDVVSRPVEEPASEDAGDDEAAIDELATEQLALGEQATDEPVVVEQQPAEPVAEEPPAASSQPLPPPPPRRWPARGEPVDEPSGAPAEEPAWGQPAAEQSGAPIAAPASPWGPSGQGSPPDVEPDQDHDGKTQAGSWDRNQFARQQPGIPGQPPAPSVTARPVARLAFSSGETIDVDRAILVGRAPEARRFSSTDQPRLMTVPSPNQEISSTHLEIRPGSGVDHGSAIVTDMGSTNGTVLVQPGLAPEDLRPGIPVQLIPGAIVDLGDGVTISVSNP